MPRNSVAVVEPPVADEVLAEVVIPQSERESIDNEFFILKNYLEGPIKAALYSGKIAKGDVTVLITVRPR